MIADGPYRVAAIQAEPCWLDADAGVEKATALIAEAASADARLVAFPELWIPGYPHFLWIDAQAMGMRFVPQYHANSIVVGDARFNRLAQAAADNEITVVMGASEKDYGSLYMSQFIFGADGDTLFTRRKLKPTHVERAMFGQGDGSHLHVVDVPGIGRLGALNCWEHLQPLSKFAMYSQGEQVHVASWPSFCIYRGAAHALGIEVNMNATQIYAVEGSNFALAATTVTGSAGMELFCDNDQHEALLGGGGGGCSRVYGPDGLLISDLLDEHAEGIVYADVDLSLIPISKMAADPSGHYSRPDATRLLFDKRPQPAVEMIGEAAPVAPVLMAAADAVDAAPTSPPTD